MSRTIPGPLAAALSASPRKAAYCVILAAKDGTRARFTTWDRPLTVDLDLGDGEEICEPGINISAITLAVGLDASNFELDGPAAGEFTPIKVRGGKWRSADVWLVKISPAVAGFAPIMKGKVGEGRVEHRRFVLEIRNAADAFNQTVGAVLSPWCRARFGDSSTGCPVVREPVAAEVIAVTDDFRFTVDLGGDHPDNFFNLGKAAFLTGELAGTADATIAGYNGTSGAVELLEPLIAPPEVGDTLNLFQGCSLLLKSDDPSLPTCLTHDAVLDFRGEPEVPSSRFYHKVSAPGAAYA